MDARTLAYIGLMLSVLFPPFGIIIGYVSRNQSSMLEDDHVVANLAIIAGLFFTVMYLILIVTFVFMIPYIAALN